ncbi:MAG: hypothetical protein CMN73_11500, partial [Sphingomonas sp.]|nr:hypothetical protein [Sphingomonas sp.]
RLAESDKPEIRTAAKDALKWENRWDGVQAQQEAENAATAGEKLRILPTEVALPDSLSEVIGGVWGCARDRGCTLLYTEGADEAFVLPNDCFAAPEQPVEAQSKPESNPRAVLEPAPFYGVGCKGTRLVRTDDGWANVSALDAERGEAQSARLREGFARGDIEIRTVESRQIFVGGEPVGEPFE